jgi:hypothetical protein
MRKQSLSGSGKRGLVGSRAMPISPVDLYVVQGIYGVVGWNELIFRQAIRVNSLHL